MKNNIINYIFTILMVFSCKDSLPVNQQLSGKWKLRNIVQNEVGIDLCRNSEFKKDIIFEFTESEIKVQSLVNLFNGIIVHKGNETIEIQSFGGTKIAGGKDEMACEQTMVEMLKEAQVFKRQSAIVPQGKNDPDLLLIGRELVQSPSTGRGTYLVLEEVK